MAGHHDVSKLVWAWEDCYELRDRVRMYARFVMFAGPCDSIQNPKDKAAVIPKSIANVRVNKLALIPVCEWMSLQRGLKMPTIDFLLESVAQHYGKHRLEPDSAQIYQEAWGLRRLSQLVKSRLYKKNPPQKDLYSCPLVVVML